MKVNKEYQYNTIGKFANDNDYEIEELGTFSVGVNFLILRSNQRDIIISFVCTGGTANGAIYKCIYSDLKEVENE